MVAPHTHIILVGNSAVEFLYRGTMKGSVHTGTSKGVIQSLNRRPKYANVSVTSHLAQIVQHLGVTSVRNRRQTPN